MRFGGLPKTPPGSLPPSAPTDREHLIPDAVTERAASFLNWRPDLRRADEPRAPRRPQSRLVPMPVGAKTTRPSPAVKATPGGVREPVSSLLLAHHQSTLTAVSISVKTPVRHLGAKVMKGTFRPDFEPSGLVTWFWGDSC